MTENKLKVVVVGAGNIGLCIASNLALKDEFESFLYTGREISSEELIFIDENGEEHRNLDITISGDLGGILRGADYILVTYPAFLRKQFIQEMEPYIEAGMRIGFISGYGGAEYMSKSLVDKGAVVFGLQRVPYVARHEDRRIARALSKKNKLYIASIPKSYTDDICSDFERMFDIPAVALKEYLAVTLVPSNPLLHLTGIYSIFKDYREGDSFDAPLKFYEEWNDDTSRMLFQYDDELQEICSKMKPLELDEVVSLKTYYESPTPEALTRKLKSIKAFEVVMAPMKEREGKYYPDYDSRMFIEDFPFGIAIIKYFGIITGTSTPAIDKILSYYKRSTGTEYFTEDNKPGKDIGETGVPANFGLVTLQDIIDFYSF